MWFLQEEKARPGGKGELKVNRTSTQIHLENIMFNLQF